MVKEINALERNHTWDIVPLPPGKSALGCKWVFALRPDSSGNLTRFKARLVARGDLQLDHEFHETFAPVAKFCSLKLILSIAAFHDLEIDQGDFDSAFVNGSLDEEIYMSQPPGFTDGQDGQKVLRLRKSLYGLKQAARIWYQTLDTLLKQFNFKRVVVDYGVWVQHETNTLILAHVDDMLLVGTRAVLDGLKPKINAVYAFKDLGPASLFLGIRITRDRTKKCIYLQQGQYTSALLQKFNITYPASTPLQSLFFPSTSPPFDVSTYQGANGSLLYLALGTRPDIAYAVIKLAQFSSNPSVAHWTAIRRTMAYLHGTMDYNIVLASPTEPPNLVGYFDSLYADDINDRHSTSGYVFYYMGGPVSWRSKKQQVLALSSTEGEYISATAAAKESQWIVSFLSEIGYPLKYTTLYGDNKGANSLVLNPMYHSRTKHIDIRFRYVTELSEAGAIKIEHYTTKKMIADILMKPLAKDTFQNLRQLLCVLPQLGASINIESPTTIDANPHSKKRGGTFLPPYTCNECNSSYSSRNALFNHLQNTGNFNDNDATTTTITVSIIFFSPAVGFGQ